LSELVDFALETQLRASRSL